MKIEPHNILKFWDKVAKPSQPEACWLWTGAAARGYGKLCIDYKNYQAHVVSWWIHVGPVPEGLMVMHNCPDGDNGLCINPHHLKLGSHKENMNDMVSKGRSTKGKAKTKERLTNDEVLAIRSCREANVPYRDIRERYNVTDMTIWRIVKGIDYKHAK